MVTMTLMVMTVVLKGHFKIIWFQQRMLEAIGAAVRADFRRLYPANAKTPTCCPSDDNRTKVTNSVTSARSLWWHVGPYFWPADLTRTANPIGASWAGTVGVLIYTPDSERYATFRSPFKIRYYSCYCCFTMNRWATLLTISFVLLTVRGPSGSYAFTFWNYKFVDLRKER